MKSASFFAVLFAVVLTTGCATTTAPNLKIHHSVVDAPEKRLPRKILLLPSDVTVSEMSAGGVIEKVDRWSKQSTANINKALGSYVSANKKFEIVALPTLSPEETSLLEDYQALYLAVGGSAYQYANKADPAWADRAKHFDYTLGDGLKFLKEKTGADAAIMVVGRDVVSSAERKAVFIIGAAFGVGIPMGQSLLSAGMIDLDTGDILWMNHNVSVTRNLQDPEASRLMVYEILDQYPGVDLVRTENRVAAK